VDEAETTNQLNSEIKRLAILRAKERANVERWGINLAIFLFAVMISNNILISQGIDPYVVSIMAVLGLAIVWLIGWRRGTQLYQRFYAEEVSSLQQEASSKAADVTAQLTPREIEMLNYLTQGYSNKKIARELNISEHTVKNHITSVLGKLNATDRTEAVVIAIRQGLIALPPSKT
jgi:DNA-binding CsgD family transcriptional regulator